MDVVAPGLLLAQAIGRWGNYFNQELFGKPTDLPWGLEIDLENRPEGYTQSETFHPTFLYESLWNLLGVVVLLLVDRRFRIKPPGLFCLYVAWYTFFRFFEELLRIDPSHEYFGLRLNAYVSIVVFVLAVLGFVWSQRREEPLRPRRGGALRARGAEDGHPEGAHPARTLGSRAWRWPCASCPSTWTRSRGPSTCSSPSCSRRSSTSPTWTSPRSCSRSSRASRSAGSSTSRRAGEFLVLVAALLELKARALFPDEELDFGDLDPEEAAGELAERLALYRRFKAAAAWLEERLAAEGDRFFRLGPAPLAPVPARPLAPQDPQLLLVALRGLAAEPPDVSLGHLALGYPPVSRFLERFRALIRKRGRFAFDREVDGLTRPEQIVAFLALLELRKRDEIAVGQTAPFEPITVWSATSAS